MRLRGLAIAAGLVAWAVSLGTPARAEPRPSLDLRYFQPSLDPRGSLYLEPVSTPGAGEWNFAGWFSHAYRSVALRNASGDVTSLILRHQTSFDLVGNVGLSKRVAIGLAIPAVVYQSGDSNPTVDRMTGGTALPAQALGDLALLGKATLVPQSELGGFGLAALGRVSLPTGSRTSMLGEGAVTTEARLLAELRLVAVALQATAGFRLRTAHRDFANESWGEEIPWGAAVSLRPQALGWDDKGRWTWVAEVHGWLPAGPDAPFTNAALSPTLIGASARYSVDDLSVLAGLEAPVGSGVGVPVVRPVAALQWAPRNRDLDGDGVRDEQDECPDLAEDRDGFEDADGCPELDDDDDGVADRDDRCPKQQEDEDGFEDEDGCPDTDNDRDGIPDSEDACRDVAGPASKLQTENGCTVPDTDGDGLPDTRDSCPQESEDRDGYEDRDGCPDTDDDGDGVSDAEDRCPREAGPASSMARLNGCPIPDKDGDTLADDDDRCPTEPETWNGVDDLDGCPDRGGKPLVVVRQNATGPALVLAKPLRFKGPAESPELDAASIPTVRAIADELNHHPAWIVAVGSRPSPHQGYLASSNAMARAFAVVLALRTFTFRDGVAETVGWSAVKDQPGAAGSGLGFLVLGAEPPPTSLAVEPPGKQP
ncbi:MAG TPA: thrombospondin type 3 repeat-containing protein [Polyangiaceae bacterium]|nr:thrombospondin type 3 repeat-containing protein [Polyangiaceae bacterium]